MFSRDELAERFWSNVDKSGECWEWTAAKYPRGYGLFYANGVKRRATHFSIWLETGEWPSDKGLIVCHHCDNPSCVRPSHLFVGTHADNMADMAGKMRHGQSKLSAEDVMAIRESPGSHRVLAERYGVHPTTIRGLLEGEFWTHIESAENVPLDGITLAMIDAAAQALAREGEWPGTPRRQNYWRSRAYRALKAGQAAAPSQSEAANEGLVERVAKAIGQAGQDKAPDYGLHQRLSWDEQMRAATNAIEAIRASKERSEC